MSFMSWRTTVAGLLAAILPYVAGIVPAGLHDAIMAAGALATALLGYFAADKAVVK